MKCEQCGGKGWYEGYHGGGASWTPQVKQCSERCNIRGYSDEVQTRLNNPKHVTAQNVLPAHEPKPLKHRPFLSLVKTDGLTH